MTVSNTNSGPIDLPTADGIFHGGAWHSAAERVTTINPSTGEALRDVGFASAHDVNAVVASAEAGFKVWRDVAPIERAKILRQAAGVLRANAQSLSLLDAADSGNPVRETLPDVMISAYLMDYFAGLVTEMKGASIPMGPDRINFSVREPLGPVARIVAFNHPLMFAAGKSAAILAAGNSVIIKPADQTPLAAMRLAELIGGLFPPGVFNVMPGGRDASAALAGHPGIAAVALIGSIGAGKSIMKLASETIKRTVLELGGKNALIAFADADPEEVAEAMVAGMNFGWCGQSCGSTSRAYIHADIHDAVLARLVEKVSFYRPGPSTDPATTMGSVASRAQLDKILAYIEMAKAEGARLVYGGSVPSDPALAEGCFVEPTIFADVTADMTIAREEIFGPVLSVFRWTGANPPIEEINDSPYGLTSSIWTNDISKAHRTASRIEAGFIWINEVAKHFPGAPYGGYKQSGIGREEGIEELLSFTQEKNIHIRMRT